MFLSRESGEDLRRPDSFDSKTAPQAGKTPLRLNVIRTPRGAIKDTARCRRPARRFSRLPSACSAMFSNRTNLVGYVGGRNYGVFLTGVFFLVGVVFFGGAFFLVVDFLAALALAGAFVGVSVEIVRGIELPSGYKRR